MTSGISVVLVNCQVNKAHYSDEYEVAIVLSKSTFDQCTHKQVISVTNADRQQTLTNSFLTLYSRFWKVYPSLLDCELGRS